MAQNPQARAFVADVVAGRVDRRELIKRGAALGFSATVLGAMADLGKRGRVMAAEEGKLKLSFYSWIPELHPVVNDINSDFNGTFPTDAEIAPVESASAD